MTFHVGRRFITYALVGAIGTAGHYATLIALTEAAGWPPVWASTCGFAVGALINYYANYRYTFTSKRPHSAAAPRFFLVAAVGAIVNSAVMAFAIGTLGFHYLVAQVVATLLVLAATFLVNMLWTFASAEPPENNPRSP